MFQPAPVRRRLTPLLLALFALALAGGPLLASTLEKVVAAGRGWPHVNLTNALPAVAGDVPAKLAEAAAEPCSLAAADFDGDGLPDLAVGYRTATGGLVRILRADVDYLFESSPAARARRDAGRPAEHPFADELGTVTLPSAPDFLAAGDLDGDRRADLVAAQRGSDSLVLATRNVGGFDVSTRSLGGAVTALAGGELDSRDGLLDVAVGVAGEASSSILLLAGRAGGDAPLLERLVLDGPAYALALGELDNDAGWDLAVATDDGVEVFHGRLADADGTARRRTTLEIPGGATQVAIGDLLDGESPTDVARNEVAALDRDGGVTRFALASAEGVTKAMRAPASADVAGATRLTVAHVASDPRSQVLLADALSPGLVIVRANGEPAVRLDAVAEPVAVLPMRLDKHPLDGLVVLLAGEPAPLVLKGVPVATHVVTVDGTGADCNTGDGVCMTNDPMLMTCTGPCTLHAAIDQANVTGGLHEIDFNLAGAGPHTVNSGGIVASTSLTIDGTSEPNYAGDPIVWHVSTQTLNLSVGSFTVRGMGLGAAVGSVNVAGAFFGNGSSNSFVEDNWIGLLGANQGPTWGILTQGGASTLDIGGTGPGMGNVFWLAETNELQLNGTGHEVAGNSFGFDPAGVPQLGGGLHGDSVLVSAVNTQIGLAGVGNLFAGTMVAAQPALRIQDSNGVTVRSNTIGLDGDGDPTGNASDGLRLTGNPVNVTIGGTAAGDGNVISGNALSGVWAVHDGVVEMFGNRIGVGADGVSDRGNGEHGIRLENAGGSSRIGGTGAGEANVIAFNGGDGVRVNAGWAHRMRRNAIFGNDGLGIELCSGASCTGPDTNDALDADGGDWTGHGNQHQNYLVITSLTEVGAAVGTLGSAAGKTYDLDFFASPACDDSGYGQARRFAASTQVTTNGSGSVAFSVPLSAAVPAGWVVSATATDVASLDTSELSLCSGPMPDGVIFNDGFESGSTSAWSSTVP